MLDSGYAEFKVALQKGVYCKGGVIVDVKGNIIETAPMFDLIQSVNSVHANELTRPACIIMRTFIDAYPRPAERLQPFRV
jgi:hypothetical protein